MRTAAPATRVPATRGSTTVVAIVDLPSVASVKARAPFTQFGEVRFVITDVAYDGDSHRGSVAPSNGPDGPWTSGIRSSSPI